MHERGLMKRPPTALLAAIPWELRHVPLALLVKIYNDFRCARKERFTLSHFAPQKAALGPLLPTASAAPCPQLEKADIRAAKAQAGFDR
jgi:hypothetical protein